MAVTYVRNSETGEFEQVGPGGATTDTTLSLSGKPADAAAVGIALTNMATKEYVNTSVASFSNPNLLINSDFRNPVNQRGKTSYIYTDAETQYTVDRWRSTGLNVSVGGSSITVKNRSQSTSSVLCQPFEHTLRAGVYTATVGCQNLSGSVYVALDAAGTNKQALSSGVNTFTFTTTEGVGGLYFLFSATDTEEGMTLYYTKLEQGSVATPFVPRLYAEELMLCQRYYQTYRDDSHIVLTQTYTNTTSTNGRFNLPVEMRTAPAITVNVFEVREINEGNVIAVLSTRTQSISNKVIEIAADHASMNVSTRYLYAKADFDAEIY